MTAHLPSTIARHLTDLGIADYRPDTDGGSWFVDVQPSQPDECTTVDLLSVTTQPGIREDDAQVRFTVRSASQVTAHEHAYAIYTALRGTQVGVWASGTTDEVAVTGCWPTPPMIRLDTNGLFEAVLRARVTHALLDGSTAGVD